MIKGKVRSKGPIVKIKLKIKEHFKTNPGYFSKIF